MLASLGPFIRLGGQKNWKNSVGELGEGFYITPGKGLKPFLGPGGPVTIKTRGFQKGLGLLAPISHTRGWGDQRHLVAPFSLELNWRIHLKPIDIPPG